MEKKIKKLLEETVDIYSREAPCYYNSHEAMAWSDGFLTFRSLVEDITEGKDINLSFY